MLRKYMSDRGKIRSRRVTGNCAQHQRALAQAIKTARELVLLPYTQRTVTERPGGRGGGRDRGDRGDRTLNDSMGGDGAGSHGRRDRGADTNRSDAAADTGLDAAEASGGAEADAAVDADADSDSGAVSAAGTDSSDNGAVGDEAGAEA